LRHRSSLSRFTRTHWLYAKAEGKPVWRLLADMTPEQIVSIIDWSDPSLFA
jgi:hypothetical protein